MDEEARWFTIPATTFDDLLRHPFRRGMASDLNVTQPESSLKKFLNCSDNLGSEQPSGEHCLLAKHALFRLDPNSWVWQQASFAAAFKLPVRWSGSP